MKSGEKTFKTEVLNVLNNNLLECTMKRFIFLITAVFVVLAFAVSCKSPPPSSAPSSTVQQLPPPPPKAGEASAAVDTSPPVLSVRLSPQPFSPDDDGVDDILTATINVSSKSDIKNWHIDIREPAPGNQLFSEWNGEGMPPQTFIWNGLSSSGELVQSATDYQFTLDVTNVHGSSSTYKGVIQVDVLVRREANGVLRVIVPSIMFAANTGNSSGLSGETLAINERILRRIAEVLNRYPTYQIKVEGHANPTTPPGTQARTEEETGTRTVKGLVPLSEERARYVTDNLVNLGVARARLTPVGVGGTRPVVAFNDRVNWWKNRRVEFILVR